MTALPELPLVAPPHTAVRFVLSALSSLPISRQNNFHTTTHC